MTRALISFVTALILTACGGSSTHTFTDAETGEQFGSGECQGDTCHFDFTFGKSEIDAYTLRGDATGPVQIDQPQVDRLLEAGAPHQLRIDGLSAPDVYLTPDGTAWRKGAPVGRVELDAGGARLVNTHGDVLKSLLHQDGVMLG